MVKQVLLFLIILVIIALFIIPINSTVLDVFIAINIVLSILVLLVALTTRSLVDFSVFPSLLLIATLARLSITVSSTRLILGEAEGGEIIATFGTFVTKGNIAVGFIVFMIVTIVNFIVITKGSERIGEVSSRFFLDALPGKQVSIDSDLRSGLINEDQAQKKRKNLDKEAQLFGSLDGTMKFVKGDAIAGLVIIVINIIGGLIVGNIQHGLTFTESALLFTTLTVGDGLVSQLPALLLSIGAAVLVSRVTDNDELEGSKLEVQLAEQLFSSKQVLIAAGVFCGLLALVPGMPILVFLLFSGLLLGSGFLVKQPTNEGKNNNLSLSLTQFVIGAPSTLVKTFEEKYTDKLEISLYEEIGLGFSSIKVVPNEDFSLMFYGQDLYCPVSITSNYTEAAHDTVDGFYLGGYRYKKCENNSEDYISGTEMFIIWLKIIITQKIRENFGIDETASLLNLGDLVCPNLTKQVTATLSTSEMNKIFQRLLSEGVYLFNIKELLSAFYNWCSKEKDEILLTELVRISLGRRIVQPYIVDDSLYVVEVSDNAVSLIESSIRYDAAGSYLDLDQSVQSVLRKQVHDLIGSSRNVVVLCHADVRRYCWSLINYGLSFYEQLCVVSPLEIPKEIEVKKIGVACFELQTDTDIDQQDKQREGGVKENG